MDVNQQVTGKVAIAGAFHILVPDIEKESTTDEQINYIQTQMKEVIHNIKRLSIANNGKTARTMLMLSPNKIAVFAAKNGDVVCYVYSPDSDDYHQDFAIKDALFLSSQTHRIESRIKNDFSSPSSIKYATFDKRINEIDILLLNTLSNSPNNDDFSYQLK